MPADRKACYGVNITGPGINANSNSCGPTSGILAGFVEPGANIEVSLPRGTDRKIELYAFLQQVGQNNPCPGLGGNLPASQLINTYLIGSANNVDAVGDVTVVEITATLPGTTHHLAQDLSLPVTCTAGAQQNNLPGFHVSNGHGVVTGGTYKIIGGVGRPVQAGVATAGPYKLLAK